MANHAGQANKHLTPRRSAFSLIELAALVTCIGLLFAIVQPSLDVARERSKHAVCLDRLRAIAEASLVYADDDPNGWAIPVHPGQFTQDPWNPTFVGAYEWGGKSGIGRPWFTPAPGVLGSKYGTKAGFGPASRPLNDLMYPHGFRDNLYPVFNFLGSERDTQLDLAAYRCPSDDGPPGAAHCPDWVDHTDRSSYDHFGNSYAANIFMTGSCGGSMSSNSPYLRPLSRVPNPPRTILYEENIGRWAWACKEDVCDFLSGIDPGPTKALRGWHGKSWTFNHVYGDGHAATRKVYVDGTEDSEAYANHYRIEEVFDDPSQQEHYRCVIIRGDGWQKDTLPDQPIYTGTYWCGEGRASNEDCVEGGLRRGAGPPSRSRSSLGSAEVQRPSDTEVSR